MKYGRKGFDFGDFTITKREIIASISIIAIMVLIGILISSKISESQMDRNERYNKAVKLNTQELFQYGMDTNIGDAFVYGKLTSVDTVTYPEIGGEYMYIKKVEERYTKHTNIVVHDDGKGNTYTTTEEEWTWDVVGKEDIKCKEISFCGITFTSNKIKLPSAEYIRTIKTSNRVRYKYYGIGVDYSGTIFASLKDKTIPNNTPFYNNMTIEETIDHLERSGGVIIFWVFWVILIGGLVFGFYYIDNNWLE